MSRWGAHPNSREPEGNDDRIEVEGITAQCAMCRETTDTTWYLPKVQALTYKCVCGHVNVLTDFSLPT